MGIKRQHLKPERDAVQQNAGLFRARNHKPG